MLSKRFCPKRREGKTHCDIYPGPGSGLCGLGQVSDSVPQGGKLILALTDPSPRKRPEISSGAWEFPRKQISVLREGLSSC